MDGGGFKLTPSDILQFFILGNRGMEDSALKGVVAGNLDKDFVQRIQNQNPYVSNSIPTANGEGRMTHLMANGDGHVFPTVINEGGPSLRQLGQGERSPEAINLGSDTAAEWFARNYKRTNPQGFGL